VIDRLADRARALDRAFQQTPWWIWPSFLAILAGATWAASLALVPHGEVSWFGGHPIGAPCAFREATGVPCPNCGMTRSFVWAARLGFARSFWYNPAGATLFWWITMGGIVGVVRLVTRDPRKLEPRWQWFGAWGFVWTVGLYLVPWFMRIYGYNPLP
jgi:hypothetical protein